MKKIRVVHEDEVEPTLFKSRISKRLITKEREGCDNLSFHVVASSNFGMGPTINHPKRDEILYFLEGEAIVFWADESANLRPGSAVYIPAGREYRLYGRGHRKVVCVLTPPVLREEWAQRSDLVRIEK